MTVRLANLALAPGPCAADLCPCSHPACPMQALPLYSVMVMPSTQHEATAAHSFTSSEMSALSAADLEAQQGQGTPSSANRLPEATKVVAPLEMSAAEVLAALPASLFAAPVPAAPTVVVEVPALPTPSLDAVQPSVNGETHTASAMALAGVGGYLLAGSMQVMLDGDVQRLILAAGEAVLQGTAASVVPPAATAASAAARAAIQTSTTEAAQWSAPALAVANEALVVPAVPRTSGTSPPSSSARTPPEPAPVSVADIRAVVVRPNLCMFYARNRWCRCEGRACGRGGAMGVRRGSGSTSQAWNGHGHAVATFRGMQVVWLEVVEALEATYKCSAAACTRMTPVDFGDLSG